jgi:hypothetical protein
MIEPDIPARTGLRPVRAEIIDIPLRGFIGKNHSSTASFVKAG